MSQIHQPGNLVKYRGREWMVLPSHQEGVIRLKPLGGSDAEITGVYTRLNIPGEKIEEATFPLPTGDNIDNFSSAKLLFNASRLSFRNVSGPFRCMGKLSFRPRAFQVVPLVMALKQDVVRLLIADDVGVGKTVEALMILRELMERGEVRSFAVLALPHLCEQWQQELKDKLDIEAEIFRSSTAASLDRRALGSDSVFKQFPFQVISIDYIKSDRRRNQFLDHCPDLVIVDEAHTCAKPCGATSVSQQHRYHLLHDIAKKQSQHLLLLTATPHSGKDEEFLSLLGLLNSDFSNFRMDSLSPNQRQRIADHFILRKRETLKRWLSETTPFPERVSQEVAYELSADYRLFYEKIKFFALGIQKGDYGKQTRMRYWAALALLRGVMSSPQTGVEMLSRRESGLRDNEAQQDTDQHPDTATYTELFESSDSDEMQLLEASNLTRGEQNQLRELRCELEALSGIEKDRKAAHAISILKDWIEKDYQPIVFCKYIATARYLGEICKTYFGKSVKVEIVTSELADEQRREIINGMEDSPKRILVATDCLSEGINLQNLFTAVLHYDLPWNPNRLEQREGRVDRFGQHAETICTTLLYGNDNPMDNIVLKILIRKVRDIQKATGVSIPLGENNASIMEELVQEVFFGQKQGHQLSLFEAERDQMVTNELDAARRKAENIRSIFAHNTIPQQEIESNLQEVDEAIGDLQTVEQFVLQAVSHLNGTCVKKKHGYLLQLDNLPPHIKSCFKSLNVTVSFESPTPVGYIYIGRNHHFVELLCQFIVALAFEQKGTFNRVARASVLITDQVQTKTTLIQFRVRNVIEEVQSHRQLISEEMFLWGYAGSAADAPVLDYSQAKALLLEAESLAQLPLDNQQQRLRAEMALFDDKKVAFAEVATARAEHLVDAHGKFKKHISGRRYKAVSPVLPPDVLGIYVLVPPVKR